MRDIMLTMLDKILGHTFQVNVILVEMDWLVFVPLTIRYCGVFSVEWEKRQFKIPLLCL